MYIICSCINSVNTKFLLERLDQIAHNLGADTSVTVQWWCWSFPCMLEFYGKENCDLYTDVWTLNTEKLLIESRLEIITQQHLV